STIGDDDVRQQVRRTMQKLRSTQAAAAESPEFSDDHLALEFAKRHEWDLRYVAESGRWLRWDGSRWAEEKTNAAFDAARHVCREAAVAISGHNGDNKRANALV